MSIDPQLLAAYATTTYRVFNPDLCIHIGTRNPQLQQLLRSTGANSWAFLTASNPYSVPLPAAANQLRNKAMARQLSAYNCYPGEGVGTDPLWPTEESLLVLGISLADAVAIGQIYEQNAIVFGEIDQPARLVVLQEDTSGSLEPKD